VSDSEDFVQAFHARRARATSSAFARGGSYERLAALVPDGARVLDLACGEGALLAHLGDRAVGIDLARGDLALAGGTVARARAQALPFATASFDVVTCHLALMLFDDLPAVIRELERVLAPGGRFLAVLGGGPTATDDDAFARFVALLPPTPPLGDRRAKTPAGWRELMPGWTVHPFERWPLDFGGTFDEVWSFLGASYEARPEHEAQLRAACATLGERIPCTAVVYLASAECPSR
jgi:SAM-dependent methyltransferase